MSERKQIGSNSNKFIYYTTTLPRPVPKDDTDSDDYSVSSSDSSSSSNEITSEEITDILETLFLNIYDDTKTKLFLPKNEQKSYGSNCFKQAFNNLEKKPKVDTSCNMCKCLSKLYRNVVKMADINVFTLYVEIESFYMKNYKCKDKVEKSKSDDRKLILKHRELKFRKFQ